MVTYDHCNCFLIIVETSSLMIRNLGTANLFHFFVILILHETFLIIFYSFNDILTTNVCCFNIFVSVFDWFDFQQEGVLD